MAIQRREITPKFEIALVSHEFNGETFTVNLRELHTKLKNGELFATWIKQRIDKYGFMENQDYVLISVITKIKNSGRGGDRRSVEYIGTLSMAKELAMVENNPIGKIARQYFIQCEKELLKQQRQQYHMPHGYPQMLEIARTDWKAKRNELIQCLSDFCGIHDRRRKSLFTDLMYINIIETRASTLREYFGLVSPNQLTRDWLHQYPQEALCELECRLIDGIISGSINSYQELIEAVNILAPMIRSMKEFQTGRIPLPSHAFPTIHAITQH